MTQNNIGNVWRLFLSPEEETEILEFLKENNLPETSEGLKEYIFDSIRPPEKAPNKLAGFVEEHPEVIQLAGNAAHTVGDILRKKLFGK